MYQKRSRCKKCQNQSVVYDEHSFAFICTDCGVVDRKRTKERRPPVEGIECQPKTQKS